MPTFTSWIRQIELNQIGYLYATTIALIDYPHVPPLALFFFPDHSQREHTIIGESTKAYLEDLGGSLEKCLQVAVIGERWHPLTITVDEVVNTYPVNNDPADRLPAPLPFIWVSARELAKRFDFSPLDPHFPPPLIGGFTYPRQIVLTARNPGLCFDPPDAALAGPVSSG